jgi:tetratricopeptide (TPR) repeat protein
MAEGLPTEPAIVFSDDPQRLLLMQAAAAQDSKKSNCLFIDTGSLPWPDYHRFLKRMHPQRWPWDPKKEQQDRIDDGQVIQAVALLGRTNSLHYLHPSFGYYFELFFPVAHGLTYQLTFYPTNTLKAPALDESLISENEAFWNKAQSTLLDPLFALRTNHQRIGVLDQLMARAHLSYQPNRTALVLASFYSHALDFWGVELQKSGRWTNAAARFALAKSINPENVVAQINFDCNQSIQVGRKPSAQLPKSVEDEFGKYRNWDQVVGENGPFDEPNFCYEQGRAFVRGRNYRQAALQFERAIALAPENLAARLWLAHLFVEGRQPDEALKLIKDIHANKEMLGLNSTNRSELLQVELSAHLVRGDLEQAEVVVGKALEHSPGNGDLLMTAAEAYLKYGHFTNALVLEDRVLSISPTNQNALLDKGYTYLQMNAYGEAIPPLTQVLQVEPTNFSAKLNRAIAYLRTDQLEAARKDYEVLASQWPKVYQVYFGLGEIAWRQQDTNAAIRNYQLYLTNSPVNTDERKMVNDRLKDLKSGTR